MTDALPEPRWWQRLLQRIAATRPGAWLFDRTTHHVDRILLGIPDGRLSTSRILAGLPTVRLTTTGAKTGKERTVPVMGIPDGDEGILVASSWGSESHPAWYHNLRATPSIRLARRENPERAPTLSSVSIIAIRHLLWQFIPRDSGGGDPISRPKPGRPKRRGIAIHLVQDFNRRSSRLSGIVAAGRAATRAPALPSPSAPSLPAACGSRASRRHGSTRRTGSTRPRGVTL